MTRDQRNTKIQGSWRFYSPETGARLIERSRETDTTFQLPPSHFPCGFTTRASENVASAWIIRIYRQLRRWMILREDAEYVFISQTEVCGGKVSPQLQWSLSEYSRRLFWVFFQLLSRLPA